MAEEFDPYHQWLGISPRHRPPTHYRLLGIEAFEPNPDVISSAADQRMAHVRTFQNGPRSFLSQEILNQLAAARACLLDPDRKAAYDDELRERIAAVRRAAAEAAQPADDDDDALHRNYDLEKFAELSFKVISLDFRKLRIKRSGYPAALEALGAHLESEGHYRNELTAEFEALEAWRQRQVTPDAPTKLEAWRRRRLLRALGAAAWERFGVAAAPPALTAPVKETSNRLSDLDAKILEANAPRMLKTFSPRNFAIASGTLIALVVLGCAGLPLKYALLGLVPLALWVIYLRLTSGRGEDAETED
jgi:hypothetical protein